MRVLIGVFLVFVMALMGVLLIGVGWLQPLTTHWLYLEAVKWQTGIGAFFGLMAVLIAALINVSHTLHQERLKRRIKEAESNAKALSDEKARARAQRSQAALMAGEILSIVRIWETVELIAQEHRHDHDEPGIDQTEKVNVMILLTKRHSEAKKRSKETLAMLDSIPTSMVVRIINFFSAVEEEVVHFDTESRTQFQTITGDAFFVRAKGLHEEGKFLYNRLSEFASTGEPPESQDVPVVTL